MMLPSDVEKVEKMFGYVLKIDIATQHPNEPEGQKQREQALEGLDEGNHPQACAMRAAVRGPRFGGESTAHCRKHAVRAFCSMYIIKLPRHPQFLHVLHLLLDSGRRLRCWLA